MDKTRSEKEAYERTELLTTEFGQEDVIVTSGEVLFDKDNETGAFGRQMFQNV